MTDNSYKTPFLYAVAGGKVENMKRLIELGANVSQKARRGISAIHMAAGRGHTEAVRLLLGHGADADRQDFFGRNPLMPAAGAGCLETVKLLLEKGANLHSCDRLGQTPLHCAAKGDHIDVVKFLLQRKANLFARTFSGEAVLHQATLLELVIFLTEQGADIHARDASETTPLHMAAGKGQSDTVKYLITCGAEVNSRDRYDKTALYYAIQRNHAATAKILIESGCEVKLRDYAGHCVDDEGVLETAARRGLTDVFRLLLDKGVPVDALSGDRQTPLMAAAKAGHCGMVVFLLDQGANINGCDSLNVKKRKHNNADHKGSVIEGSDCEKEKFVFNQTPLYCALEAGQGEVAKLLIEQGADTSDSDGKTHSLAELAALHGLSDVFHLLTKDKSFHFNKIKDGETLLTSAARHGDFDSVKFLLQNGADVNAKNSSGDTALSCAVQSSAVPDFEIVKLLLAFDAKVNTRNDKCETPLLIAAEKNADKVANLLVEHGCDTNVKDFNSYSPLHFAAKNNNGKLTEKLLQYGADPSSRIDEEGMTALHVAAKSGSVLVAEVLLDHGVDLEVTTYFGESPLVIAAQRGDLRFAVVQFLAQKGSNVNARDRFGMTPLINAKAIDYRGVKSLSLIKALLDRGSSVNSVDDFGRSVLHQMSFSQNATEELYDLLLQHEADLNISDKNGETPLHFAASHGNTRCIEWLIEQGADVGALDRKNRTPLHSAAYKGGSVELLIQHGADIHLTDSNGWLPLHFAVAGEQRMAFEVLLQNGSDITAVDNKGRTVFHLVAKYGRYVWAEMVELLIGHGCDINARDFSGQSVFGASLTG